MVTVDRVWFNGVVFRRYPEARRRANRIYFTPSGNDRKRGVGHLHQEIWRAVHGPIPDGHHIHHRDLDALNNDPGNLVALSASEHSALHAADATGRRKWVIEHRYRAQAAARDWHRSAEGRAWHSQHGRETWVQREPIERACEQCGAAFASITRRASDRFCSNACKSKWRRAAGVDVVTVPCAWCGQPFAANKYDQQRTCSRACGQRLRRGSPPPGL